MSVDLFGKNIEFADGSIQAGLIRKDKATLDKRARRWQFLEDLRQGAEASYMGSIEGSYLFRESELAFVDGHYAATILLALAIVERMLQGWLIEHGHIDEARKGMGRILKFVRRHELLHPFILDEIDKLRRKRNHFAHFKTDDNEMRLDMRMHSKRNYDPHAVMMQDAELALSLLHYLYSTRPGRIKVKE